MFFGIPLESSVTVRTDIVPQYIKIQKEKCPHITLFYFDNKFKNNTDIVSKITLIIKNNFEEYTLKYVGADLFNRFIVLKYTSEKLLSDYTKIYNLICEVLANDKELLDVFVQRNKLNINFHTTVFTIDTPTEDYCKRNNLPIKKTLNSHAFNIVKNNMINVSDELVVNKITMMDNLYK